jgi:hypothetical protein
MYHLVASGHLLIALSEVLVPSCCVLDAVAGLHRSIDSADK